MPRLFCSGPPVLPPPTRYRPWSLFFFLAPRYLPSRGSASRRLLQARLFGFNVSFASTRYWSFHYLFHPSLHLLDLFSSSPSPLSARLSRLLVAPCLLLQEDFKQLHAAGGRSLRQVLSGAAAEVGLCITRAGEAPPPQEPHDSNVHVAVKL